MKRCLSALVWLLAFSGSLCLAQTDQPTIKEDFKPSTLNQPGQQYPQVNSQGYARFRIVAPKAQSVSVSLGLGGRGGTVLTRAADSTWMGTTSGPLDKGFHYYHLSIDGGTFNDPGTLNFYGSIRWESGIEIPAQDQDFYALKDVPHGKVQHRRQDSLRLQRSDGCFDGAEPLCHAGRPNGGLLCDHERPDSLLC